ncbi:MAG: hypothetical protein AAF591_09695 [Verrucomicrobiota bacterium]
MPAIVDGADGASNFLQEAGHGRMRAEKRQIFGMIAAMVVVAAMAYPVVVFGGEYRAAPVDNVLFGEDSLGLTEMERENFANELAGYVSNLFAGSGDEKNEKGKVEAGQLDLASRMLAVALQLQNRNRTALVANFKLQRGLNTQAVETEHPPDVLADFLYVRSKVLMEQGGEDNELLAGYLLSFAVELDPENEDAIYDLELRRLDGAPIDWELLYDSPGDRERLRGDGAAGRMAGTAEEG